MTAGAESTDAESAVVVAASCGSDAILSHWLRSAIDFKRPNDRIDVVAVCKLYQRMAEAGELTTRATVQGWLEQWGVRHVP